MSDLIRAYMSDLIQFDQDLMLKLNGSDSLYMDGVMKLISSTWVWIPLAIVAMIIFLKNNSLRNFILVVFMFALTVFLCDKISSGVIKPWVGRLRPSHDPMILHQIDIVNGSRSGKYGFLSSHATNTFGVFMFVTLLVRHRLLGISLFIWASIDSFSRIYLGLHYPGDILCGAILGVVIATLVYLLYYYIHKCIDTTPSKITNYYTRTGYLVEDIEFLNLVLYITYAFIILYAFVYIQIIF